MNKKPENGATITSSLVTNIFLIPFNNPKEPSDKMSTIWTLTLTGRGAVSPIVSSDAISRRI